MSELKSYTIYEGDVGNYTEHVVYSKSEADAYIRKMKYKRCLDKAEMCKAKYDEEDAKVNGCGASWEYINKEMKYWERWRWRWEAIAEKFNDKEA